MNTFLGTVTYTGDKFTDNGLRFMEMTVPAQGKSGVDVPLLVFPNRAAGESFDVFQPGARLLLNGRLYPSRTDYKMYFIPNQQFQLVNDKSLVINKVSLSGKVGFINEKKISDLFAFLLICNAPSQQVIGYRYDDGKGLGFSVEGWGEDAKRLEKILHVGRDVSVEGILRYNSWTTSEGQQRGNYQVRIRSGLIQAFGKNKNLVERADGTPVSNGYRKEPVTVATVPKNVDSVDTTPCSVNPDEIPF